MKNIFRYIAGTLFAGLVMTACSPEEFEGADGNIPQVTDFADNFVVTVDQTTNYANFEFKSATGVSPVWIIDGESYSASYSFSKYYRKKGDYTVECKVKNANGMSDGVITKTFTIEKTKMNGFGGFVEDSDFNLFKGVTFSVASFYYAPGWGQIADPKYTYQNGAFVVTLPEATTDQWQAQMHVELDKAIALPADKTYDFSVILTSTTAHPGVTVKVQQKGDDNTFIDMQRVSLEANEPKCVWFSDVPGVDITDLKFALDFGGNAANTEITIESFVLKDHANDDGTEIPKKVLTPFNYDDSANIWKAIDENSAFTQEFYFGDDNWGAIDCNPETTHDGSKHTIVVPVLTSAAEIWRAQWKFHTDLSATIDDTVDFSVKINSTVKLPGLIVKLTQDGDDDNFFFASQDVIPAGDFVFKIENAKLAKDADAPKLMLVLGFGGAPEGAVITISDITVIKK